MTCGRPVHLRMANDESPDRTSFQSKKCRQPKDEQRCSREYIVDTAMRHEYSHPGKQTGCAADGDSRGNAPSDEQVHLRRAKAEGTVMLPLTSPLAHSYLFNADSGHWNLRHPRLRGWLRAVFSLPRR